MGREGAVARAGDDLLRRALEDVVGRREEVLEPVDRAVNRLLGQYTVLRR